jgi:Tol biopolymer transport system component
MTSDSFDRRLAAWLDAEAEGRVHDHLAEVLVLTRATRQRPAWSSLERWLPVDLTLRPIPFLTGRTARLAFVVMLLLAAAATMYLLAGVARTRVPPPFGLAQNGLVASSRSGDVYVTNADGTGQRLLIGGASSDTEPVFSRDGQMLAFLRLGSGGDASLMLARADGTGIKTLTATLRSVDSYTWSPDGRSIAIVHAGDAGRRILSLVDVAGAAPIKTLQLPFNVDNAVYWRPPDGAALILTGRATDGDPPAVYSVTMDGTYRPLTPQGEDENAYQSIVLSPDGRTAAFQRWERDDALGGTHAVIYVLDLDTGLDRALYLTPGADEVLPQFSPDGGRLAFVTDCVGECGQFDIPAQVVVVNVDGTQSTSVGEAFEFKVDPVVAWSPDGAEIVIGQPDGRAWRMAASGPGPMTEVVGGFTSWQRLAP